MLIPTVADAMLTTLVVGFIAALSFGFVVGFAWRAQHTPASQWCGSEACLGTWARNAGGWVPNGLLIGALVALVTTPLTGFMAALADWLAISVDELTSLSPQPVLRAATASQRPLIAATVVSGAGVKFTLSGMATTSVDDVVLRLAASAYLGRYTATSRIHSEPDLWIYLS
jgi:hypothetical protein